MRQITLLQFGLLLLLSVNQKVTSQPKCYIKTNGCSVPLNLPFFYKKKFTSACVKHDICYYCGKRWGWERLDCDRTFKQDMQDACDGISRRKRWFFPNKVKLCKKTSDVYYAAVRVAGSSHWADPSPSWCEQSCARDQGDPKRLLGK